MREWVAAGIEVPALGKEPELLFHEYFALECYFRIALSRPPSMGSAPLHIPMSEVAAAYDYYRDIRENFSPQEWARLVLMLDNALIKDAEKKEKSRKRPRKKVDKRLAMPD